MAMMGGEVLIVLGLVAVVFFVLRGSDAPRWRGGVAPDQPDAREILAERFARGEVSEEEFEQRTRVLERQPK
jgi:putative membrane protein